jgi:hypothetical protein
LRYWYIIIMWFWNSTTRFFKYFYLL